MYLQLDLDFFGHPKVLRLRRILGPCAEVYPVRLWAWAAKYSPAGLLPSLDELEAAAGWIGDPGALSHALLEVGFMDDGNKLHGWDERTGGALKSYEAKKLRQRKAFRKSAGRCRQNAGYRREEKRREEKIKEGTAGPAEPGPAVAASPVEPGPRTSWLSPYLAAWRDLQGGEPQAGKLSRYLRPLHERHGPERTVKAWRKYLEQAKAEYVSPARFAETFGQWAPQVPRPAPQPKPAEPRATPEQQAEVRAQLAAMAERMKCRAPAEAAS